MTFSQLEHTECLTQLKEAQVTIVGFMEAETEDNDNTQNRFLCQKTDKYNMGNRC